MNQVSKDRLEGDISYFYNVYNHEAQNTIKFKEYLAHVALGTYKNQVINVVGGIDKAERRDIKATLLPAVTIAGVFDPIRRIHCFTYHSGVIAIDVDGPDSASLEDSFANITNIATTLKDDEFVLATHFTPSYRGIAIYFSIPYFTQDTIEEINRMNGVYYASISRYLKRTYNIESDPAPKSVASLRFFSADKNINVNEECKIYTVDAVVDADLLRKKPTQSTAVSARDFQSDGTSSIDALDKLIDIVLIDKVDITKGYLHWIKIGFGLCTSFGEEGRDAFHKICSQYDAYNYAIVNRKYTSLLRDNRGMVTANTVFKYAFEAGVHYNDKRL